MRGVQWLGLILVLAAPLWVEAAPSNSDPYAPLDVRNAAENERLQQEAQTLYEQVRLPVQLFMEKLENGQLRTIKPRAIGDAAVGNLRLGRLADRLTALKETAGIDFKLRSNELGLDLQKLVNAYRALPGVGAQLSQGYAIFKNEAQKKKQIIPKLQKLCEQGEWEQAETEFYAVFDELSTMGVWYDPQRQIEVLKDFYPVQNEIRQQLGKQRDEAAAASLAALRTELTPKFFDILAQFEQGQAAIAATGSVALDGRTVDGPQFLEAMGKAWMQAQHGTLQCLGVDWARGMALGRPGSAELDQLVQTHRDFTAKMTENFVALIVADAQRTPPQEAAQRYRAYLTVVAPVAALTAENPLPQTLQGALDKFLAASPELNQEVLAYEAATADLMRWRRRYAEACAKHHAGNLQPLPQVYATQVKVEPPLLSMIKRNESTTEQTELNRPAPLVMAALAERMVGQNAVVPGLTGVAKGQSFTIGHFNWRTYTQVKLPPAWSDAVQGLRRDLLVDETHPPLTLAAALAVASAERGDLRAVGGAVRELYLEGVVPRFTTLKSAGWTLAPLGTLPDETIQTGGVKQVMMRFMVEPTWLHHEYLFLAPSAAAAQPLAFSPH